VDDEEGKGYIDIYGASATNRLPSHQRKRGRDIRTVPHTLQLY